MRFRVQQHRGGERHLHFAQLPGLLSAGHRVPLLLQRTAQGARTSSFSLLRRRGRAAVSSPQITLITLFL